MAQDDTPSGGTEAVFAPVEQQSESGAVEHRTVSGDAWSSQGRTFIATRHGYAFQPSDTSLPVVTSTPVAVTAEQAERIVTESDAYNATVYIVNKEG